MKNVFIFIVVAIAATFAFGNANPINQKAQTATIDIGQRMAESDIAITQKIRDQIVQQKFSVKAQNIAILTEQGKVTLKGSVASAKERAAVENIAKGVAGSSSVLNETVIDQ